MPKPSLINQLVNHVNCKAKRSNVCVINLRSTHTSRKAWCWSRAGWNPNSHPKIGRRRRKKNNNKSANRYFTPTHKSKIMKIFQFGCFMAPLKMHIVIPSATEHESHIFFSPPRWDAINRHLYMQNRRSWQRKPWVKMEQWINDGGELDEPLCIRVFLYLSLWNPC